MPDISEVQEARGSDRVHIEKSVHALYQQLTERATQQPEAAPFFTMKDVFMWAVALGVRSGIKKPLSDAKTQIFRWDQFSQDQDIPVLKAIALADEKPSDERLTLLSHPDRILRIVEEYANTGIHELREELIDAPGQPLWNLVGLSRGNI